MSSIKSQLIDNFLSAHSEFTFEDLSSYMSVNRVVLPGPKVVGKIELDPVRSNPMGTISDVCPLCGRTKFTSECGCEDDPSLQNY